MFIGPKQNLFLGSQSEKLERARQVYLSYPLAKPPIIITPSNRLDCKTVRIFAYSSTREQSNKRCGTRLKTESETGERLARFARLRILSHALPISLLILRKKPTVLQSSNRLARVFNNSLNQYHGKCIENCVKKMHADKSGFKGQTFHSTHIASKSVQASLLLLNGLFLQKETKCSVDDSRGPTRFHSRSPLVPSSQQFRLSFYCSTHSPLSLGILTLSITFCTCSVSFSALKVVKINKNALILTTL